MNARPVFVKICGITTLNALDAAIFAKADFIGFVFYDRSKRYIEPNQAKILGNKISQTTMKVGLFVDPSLSLLEKTISIADLDIIQLHGHETPEQVQIIKETFGLPVIKALRIASRDDLKQISEYESVSDWLIFDAKSEVAQGGTGGSFDWALLKDLSITKPWMLAGGLHSKNISQALSILKPDAVDVSSGVEDAPGLKNPDKIKEFIEAVRQNS